MKDKNTYNKNNNLGFIPTAEGRAVLKTNIYKNPSGAAIAPPTAGGPYLYEYSLKDHLGNLRVACRCGDPSRDQAGVIIVGTEPLRNVQVNHYDPWGMSLGTPPDTKQTNLNNRYQYNGKELTEDFDVGLYEYGFRWYDAQIAKFVQVDPLVEITMEIYGYVSNNPIKFTDPTGMVKELPDDQKLDKGDWHKSDRENNTNVWKNANVYNLQQKNGSKEYVNIKQRADFYSWY